ncbi:MAG: tRNA pseudouridine(55) synthase TruB [Gemmatimonadota bacterium]
MDKPAGPTSFDVVARVRRICRLKAVGHTGTLDPFATGLLVVLLGGATRLARFLESESKRYLATIRLGSATDTDDLTGTTVREAEPGWAPSGAEIQTALAGFRGTGMQRPPPYSAKKVDGQRSYVLARQGVAPELAPVEITVHSIDLVSRSGHDLVVRVDVSAGTYIRALARDLGERLGGAAHLIALRREAVGSFEVTGAVPLEALTPDSPLLSPVELLAGMAQRELTDGERIDIGHGRAIRGSEGQAGRVALVREGRLIAVAEMAVDRLRPVVVLETAT